MNLLVLDQFSEPGGAQRCLLDLLPAMFEQEWKVTVAAPAGGPLLQEAAALGAQTATIDLGPFSSGRKSALETLRFAVQTLPLGRHIRRIAKSIGADLIYANGPRVLPAVAAARTHLPVLFHSHSYLSGTQGRIAGACLRQMRATVAANCKFVAQCWKRFVAPDRLHVMYNGVDAAEGSARPMRREQPVIGCIGRIAPQKGQHRFLETARQIVETIPTAKFVIYGARLFGDGPRYEEEVRAAAAGLPVEFRGWTANVGAALAEMDVLIVPSSFPEATTRVVLEAFAARVPVAALRCGGVEEVIAEGRTGRLAGSTEELAQATIDLLCGDPAQRVELTEAAYALWSRDFTRSAYRRRMLRLLPEAAIPLHSRA